MKTKIEKVSKSSYMNVQDVKCTVSYAFFGFNVCGPSSQITPYYLKLYFAVGVLL